ncbi:MAG: Lrp/AsnC family transcriptional regulator [Candidatus Thorarchaeota archaeon]
MVEEVDDKDKALMNVMQNFFPISKDPYREIGNKIGLKRKVVISRLEKLYDMGLIRKVGAIVSARNIGFISMLAAVSVPEDEIEKAAKIISSYRGVTHNYLRTGRPNVWFTLTEPNKELLDQHLNEIENKINSKVIRLPSQKLYKIGVKFDIR